jgi:hypothetical protein
LSLGGIIERPMRAFCAEALRDFSALGRRRRGQGGSRVKFQGERKPRGGGQHAADRIEERLDRSAAKKERLTMMKALLCLALGGALAAAPLSSISAHDIYTGVKGKNGALCCGGNDCAATVYRERAGRFEFLTREQEWIEIPQERITFLPIPGDPPNDDTHHAHLCYRSATESDRRGGGSTNVFESIFLYCAFIPPGSI